MNPVQYFEYGKSSIQALQPNTFIGGVASIINTPSLLAAKLLNYPSGSDFSPSNIYNFTIVGDNIECFIDLDYNLRPYAFKNTANTISSPTYWIDIAKKCKLLPASFYVSNNTAMFYFPGCLTIHNSSFYHSNYTDLAPRILYFPLATNIGGDPSVADTTMFGLGDVKQKIYANIFNKTSNSGGVNATIAHGIANDMLEVEWVTGDIYTYDQLLPNPITDLSISNVYGSAVQLNFTAPTGSTNAIEFYEVYANGVYKGKIQSGGYCIGLSLDTTYTFEVKPVDIYYNKSTSNTVSQKTNASEPYPVSSIISYYKMEGNVLDSFGANNGTPTAITYAAGLVGQAAVLNGSTSFINLGDTDSLSFIDGTNDKPFSISYWIKTTDTKFMIFSKLNSSYSNNEYFGYYNGGVLTWRLFSNGSYDNITQNITTNAIISGAWVHVVHTYNGLGNGGMKTYINGTLVSSASIMTGTYVKMANTNNELWIGNYQADANFKLNGQLDEMPIFNKELTAAEVSEIFAKGNSGQSLI